MNASIPTQDELLHGVESYYGSVLDVQIFMFLITLVGTDNIEQGKLEQIQLLCFWFVVLDGQYSGVSFVCIIKEEELKPTEHHAVGKEDCKKQKESTFQIVDSRDIPRWLLDTALEWRVEPSPSTTTLVTTSI